MDTLNDTLLTINETLNSTAKVEPSTPGLVISTTCIFFTAVITLYFGCARSVQSLINEKETKQPIEVMSSKDAKMFPLYASFALFSLYCVFKTLSKYYLNLLLSSYFAFAGIYALAELLTPNVIHLFPSSFPKVVYKLIIKNKPDNTVENWDENLDIEFNCKNVAIYAFCSIIGVIYVCTQHWITNNLFSIAMSISAIEMLRLNKVMNGVVLLCGLFVYDIFWVFGTDVMVSVAKSFEAPIKIVFPRDILTQGFFAKDFGMLGLGDIVIPGIFIALLLRFDHSLNRGNSRLYFWSGFIAYVAGLLLTFIVMYVFKHPQPALLYLVPMCIGLPGIVALVNGDTSLALKYCDIDEEENEKAKKRIEAEAEEKNAKKDSKKAI